MAWQKQLDSSIHKILEDRGQWESPVLGGCESIDDGQGRPHLGRELGWRAASLSSIEFHVCYVFMCPELSLGSFVCGWLGGDRGRYLLMRDLLVQNKFKVLEDLGLPGRG